MKILKYLGLLSGVYIISWTIVYAVLMNLDFKYYLNYLWLSWTDSGEMPAYIQAVSVIITLLLAMGFMFWKYVANKGQ
jgi:hypothetical protein